MEYINSLTEDDLISLISETKNSLFVVMPLLQPKILSAINELTNEKEISINIGIDFAPETFRQGYGEIEYFKESLKRNYNIIHIKDNRISFLISDDKGFYLFIESRYLIPADKKTINAVKIDPVSIVRLKHQFFEFYNKAEITDQIANAIIDESIQLKELEKTLPDSKSIESNSLDENMYESVDRDLQGNPPLKPDFKRVVDFYSNKFQYVKLEFSGANIKSMKIDIPQKALPIKNADLKKKFRTKINLFDKSTSSEAFKSLDDFHAMVDNIRKDYTTPLKIRKENIIVKIKKVAFVKEVDKLKEKLEEVKKDSLNKISLEIDETKKNFEKEFRDFIYENIDEMIDNDLFSKSDESYKRQEAMNLSNEILKRIKWPKAYELMSDCSKSIKTIIINLKI